MSPDGSGSAGHVGLEPGAGLGPERLLGVGEGQVHRGASLTHRQICRKVTAGAATRSHAWRPSARVRCPGGVLTSLELARSPVDRSRPAAESEPTSTDRSDDDIVRDELLAETEELRNQARRTRPTRDRAARPCASTGASAS